MEEKKLITVVIPTINQSEYTDIILTCILENTIHPEKIILINDGGNINSINNMVKKCKKLKIEVINHKLSMGVNYSWNEGIKLAKTEIISVLNNDLVLNKYFFEKIIESYNSSDWGIICPSTNKDLNYVKNFYDNSKIILETMRKREGWCWSARSSFIKNIKPIPNFLRNYCGDDYIFYQAMLLKKSALKMINNPIYHYGSKTVGVLKECNGLRIKEKFLWNKFKESLK